MMDISVWISPLKTDSKGRKFAVSHRHVEVMRKPEGTKNDACIECTERHTYDSYYVYKLCENYQRGKMVNSWRFVKCYERKEDALNHWNKIK